MKENLLFYLKNPLVVSVCILILLFYTRIIKLPDENHYFIGTESVTSISGTIKSNPVKKNNGYYQCTMLLEKSTGKVSDYIIECSAFGKISVLIPEEIVEALYPGKLYSLSNSKSLLVEENSRLILYGRITRNCFIAKKVENIPQKKSFINTLYSIRANIRLAFKRLMYSWGSAGGLILSLLCGSREYIEDGVGDNFRKAGLSHILALSGMHLSFFTGIFTWIAKKTFGKKFSFIFSLTGIIFFVFLVGFTPSLFRSFVFTFMVLFAKELRLKEIKLLPLLAFVFLFHSIFIPEDVFSLSFMLSYAALAGIILFSDLINHLLIKIIPGKISSSLAASISALSTTIPVSANVFGQIMPVSVISSLFVSPLISLFMGLSFFAVFLCLLMPFLAEPFGCIIKIIYGGIKFLVNFFSRVPPVTL